MFLNNFSNEANLITFKEKSKVKSHIRRGRVVKQHNRKRDMLIGGGIGAVGVGLLGGAYMLGRRGKLPPVTNVNGLDELTKLIKKPTVTKVRITKSSKVNKQLDDITTLLKDKQNITVNVPPANVTVNIPNSTINRVVDNQNISNVAEGAIQELKIRTVTLPKRVNSLAPVSIKKNENLALNMSDIELEKEIGNRSNKLGKYQDSLMDVKEAQRLNTFIEESKNPTIIKISEGITGRKYSDFQLTKGINDALDYFGLTKTNINNLNKFDLNVDNTYMNKLNKLTNREKSILDIYQSELTRRRFKPTVSTNISDDDINRMSGLLDDFNSPLTLAEFNKYHKTAPNFFLTSSPTVEFARRKGSKDRVKRMSRLGAKMRIGFAGAIGGLSGSAGGAMLGGKKGALIGAGIGSGLAASSSYVEHKKSAYSPIGKKKWKNYKVEPRMYGIPVKRLSLIKGLDQQ